MSHVAEEWTDRYGHVRTTCAECEEPWPCRGSRPRPAGWLLTGLADVEAVIDVVAHGFNVSVDDIRGDSGRRHVRAARHCAMAVVRTMSNLSFESVGQMFGKDQSSVRHAVRKVMADPELRRAVELVVAELRPAPRLFAVPGEAVS